MANANFTCVLDAWRDGTTLYGRMHYSRSGSYLYQDPSFPDPTMNLAGEVFTDTDFGNRVRAGLYVGDVYTTTFSRTVSGTGSRTVIFSAGSGQRSDFAGTWSANVDGFPGTTSPPTDLTFKSCTAGPDYYDIGVSVSGWGNGGSASQRYIEAQVWTKTDTTLVPPRRYQPSYGTTSATIRVTNSSPGDGDLAITPNTIYTVGIYATNGAASVGSLRIGNHCSAPPTVTISSSVVTTDSITLDWSFGNQGGAYSLPVQYSLDGTNWTTMSTQTGSGAKSGSYTITGLSSNSQYTIRSRIARTENTGQASYITAGNTLVARTSTETLPNPLYGSVDGTAKKVKILYGSANGKAKKITKLYGSVNGKAKLFFKS